MKERSGEWVEECRMDFIYSVKTNINGSGYK